MNHEGELMGFANVLSGIRRWWRNYGLEAACDGLIDEWEYKDPERLDMIWGWIQTNQIPDDEDMRVLCEVYRKRLEPRPCYRPAKT
ncbi:MAG: hypothetical protein JXC85_04485 [Candidatus Aenigmarchaeota archaeon]|nr:hypothetical protein [Candidatus Aenigmarchaeota archaeon]